MIKLTSTTSAAVIKALKSVFSRHGIPETVRSDNGPQIHRRNLHGLQAHMSSTMLRAVQDFLKAMAK